MTWEQDNEFERSWWGNCLDTTWCEVLEHTYMRLMGFKIESTGRNPYRVNLEHRSVIDIGGGPISILLKCRDLGLATIVDPCVFPDWVYSRYDLAGIRYLTAKAENLDLDSELGAADEVWIYNCLQHVEDPDKVVANALKLGRIVRVCEPVGTKVSIGHPHAFDQEWLDEHFLGEGKVTKVNEPGVSGTFYHGVFKGDGYDH